MYALPFIVVLAALIGVKNQKYKPYCVAAGILCTMGCSIYVGNMSVSQCIATLAGIVRDVLIGNYSLFLTLLFFGVLIRVITESGALEEVAIKLNRAISGKLQFWALLFMGALVASVDDYLACILLVMVFATCYEQFGLTKAELGFFVNTVVVAFCSMVPISTWAPVISEALTSSNGLMMDHMYLRYGFNFFSLFSLLAISIMLISKKGGKAVPHKRVINDGHTIGWRILLAAVAILYVAYIVSSNSSIVLLSGNALLISCLSSLIFCHAAFRRSKKVARVEINRIYAEGVRDMLGLVKFLAVLWVYTECLETMLHINETVLMQVNGMDLPMQLLPAAVYLFSGIISYCTGSVFATVRLLVPISITLGIGLNVAESHLWLIASAAINGSLLASVSPLSDTMSICSEKLKHDSNMMYRAHLPYSLMVIVLTAVSYALAGVLIERNVAAAAIVSNLVMVPIIGLYIYALPYMVCIMKNRERELFYRAGLTILYDINDLIRRFVKHSRWYVKQWTNASYQSSKPKRSQPIYRFKIC